MIEAISALVIHLFAAMLMAAIAVGLVIVGVLRFVWSLFCWPASWFSRT